MRDVPLKHLCILPAEYGLNIAPDRYRDEGVRLLRTSDIAISGGVRDSGGVFLDAVDVPPEMRLRNGDLLFSRSGTLGRALLYSRDQHGDATFAGFLVRFRLRRGIDPRAIRYWSESSSFVGTVASQAIQSTISNFNADRYANLAVPGWLVEHSVAVADYLDAATARINRIVDTRRRQIDALEEARNSSAHRLLPALQVSSVPRIKHVAHVASGGTPSTEDSRLWTDAGGTPWVAIADMSNGLDVYSTTKQVTDAGLVAARLEPGMPGTLLFAMYASVGATAFLRVSAVWNQAILGLWPLPDHAEPRFLRYWLDALKSYWPLVTKSNTQDNLSAETVMNAPYPHLSVDAQIAIADHLDAIFDRVRRRRTVLLRQVDLLVERRQVLITAAVTGQLNIPGVAA